MTLREWLDVYTADGDAALACAWRKRAWRAMRPVVEKFVAERDAGKPINAGRLLCEIEIAGATAEIKPTSKRWSQEWAKLGQIISRQPELWPPTSQDVIEACSVARDAEEEGNLDRARQIMREQAPDVLGRPCGACGAEPGDPCTRIEGWNTEGRYATPQRAPMIVPHASRVEGAVP